MKKKMFIVSAVLVLSVAAPSAFADMIISPDNPGKMAEVEIMPNTITITCLDDLQDTPFTCGDGVGPFSAVVGNQTGNPDAWNYHRSFCTPGESVTVDVWRYPTGNMDVFAVICDGDQCGQSNAGWSTGSCPGGGSPLAVADDVVGPVCAAGPFSDPSMTIVCPPSGVFTVGIGDFLGTGGLPEYEVHCEGCTPNLPMTGPLAAIAILVSLLGGLAFVMSRRRLLAS